MASTLLAFGFGAWALRHYLSPEGATLDLIFASSSAICAVALIWYGRYFLKKLKHTSYL